MRSFFNVRRLFFWTGFNGTRVFFTQARVPDGEIFGGGERERINIGVLLDALRLATEFENACNPFLRETATSLLTISKHRT